jgi:CheY-like chemotaxis protein
MRLGYFDIRRAADRNASRTAEDYLSGLNELLERIPEALGSLTEIADGKNKVDNMNCLFDVKRGLESLGCQKFSRELDGVLSVLSSKEAVRKLAVDLAAFYDRVLKVKNVPKSLIGGGGPFDQSYVDLLKEKLPRALEQLDKEEGTRRLQVLAVDDAAFMLRSISSVLVEKYRVYTLTKPTVVEMFLEHVVPELFLLDYKMPEMSGLDLIRIIRAHREHESTPVIFLTAMNADEHFSNAIKSGACDYIIKPFKNEVLLKKVDKHIKKKKLF